MSPDPRNDPQDAYDAFMSMRQSEWLGLIGSLAHGGVLTPAEQEGFDRAVKDRRPPVFLEIEVTADQAAKLKRWHDEPSQQAFAGIDVLGLVEDLATAAAS